MVMLTVNRHTYPTFVRATSSFEAITKAVEKWDFIKMAHAYSAETFVVDPDSLQDVMPNMKQLARFYWMQAQENASHVCEGNEADFEAAWEYHGVQLDDGK